MKPFAYVAIICFFCGRIIMVNMKKNPHIMFHIFPNTKIKKQLHNLVPTNVSLQETIVLQQ